VPDFAAAAEQAIRALVDKLHPRAIIWFGSASRGQAGPNSDLDFLIVADRADGDRDDLFDAATKAIWNVRAPIDLLIFYPDEVAQRRNSLGSVVREALTTGRVMHGQV